MGENSGQWVVAYATGNSSGTHYVSDERSANQMADALRNKGAENVQIMPASEYKKDVHRWWK
jgi:hypothetical protein